MMCIDYAASFIKAGDDDPIERQMKDFVNEKIVFKDMPEDIKSFT